MLSTTKTYVIILSLTVERRQKPRRPRNYAVCEVSFVGKYVVKIIYFARKHNWMNETNDKWNIFHVMTKYKICIIPSISGKTDRKIAAIITVESIDGFSQKLNLYWELDSKYKNSEFLMPELSKGLEEKSIWKADYVLRWMDNELINAANEFYERDNLKNKKLFNQLIKIVGARLKEYFK